MVPPHATHSLKWRCCSLVGPKSLLKKSGINHPTVIESHLRLRAQGALAFLVQHFHEGDDVTNDDFTYRRFTLINYIRCSVGPVNMVHRDLRGYLNLLFLAGVTADFEANSWGLQEFDARKGKRRHLELSGPFMES
jgi:hypothetical protein